MEFNTDILAVLSIVFAVLMGVVNFLTELAKAVHDFKSTKSLNIFVVTLSVVLTVLTALAGWEIYKLKLTWYIFVAFIIFGFAVGFAAMFGYDKLLSYFKKGK